MERLSTVSYTHLSVVFSSVCAGNDFQFCQDALPFQQRETEYYPQHGSACYRRNQYGTCLLYTSVGQEHYDVAQRVKQILQRNKELQDIISILGMEELSAILPKGFRDSPSKAGNSGLLPGSSLRRDSS